MSNGLVENPKIVVYVCTYVYLFVQDIVSRLTLDEKVAQMSHGGARLNGTNAYYVAITLVNGTNAYYV